MAHRTPADEQAARELYLYADNTSELYNQKRSIIDNLRRKANKGIYDHSKAIKLWKYWMEAAARSYCKEFGCHISVFSPATRELAASMVESDEWAEYECNGWA